MKSAPRLTGDFTSAEREGEEHRRLETSVTRRLSSHDQNPGWWLKKVVVLPAAPPEWPVVGAPEDAEWTLAREGAQRLSGEVADTWSPRDVQAHRTPATLWALAAGLVLHSREIRSAAAAAEDVPASPEARAVYQTLGTISSASQSLSWRGVRSPAELAAIERRLLGAVLPAHLKRGRSAPSAPAPKERRVGFHLRRREGLLVLMVGSLLTAAVALALSGETMATDSAAIGPEPVHETWSEGDLLVVELSEQWAGLTHDRLAGVAVRLQLDAGALGLRPVELRDGGGRSLVSIDRLGRPLTGETGR
jgi:hypothetical protein